ncbi:hypothetical protein [Clostridium thermarum]
MITLQGSILQKQPFTIDELEEIYPASSKLAKSDEAARKRQERHLRTAE